MPFWKVLPRNLDNVNSLVARQRIHAIENGISGPFPITRSRTNDGGHWTSDDIESAPPRRYTAARSKYPAIELSRIIVMWLAKLKQLLGNTKLRGDESRYSQWCLIGNIVEARLFGEGGKEFKSGTKHFPPGTKVYCFPALWGDGYEKVMVIGRHRGSHTFVTMIINSEWVTNWRAKVVYNPEVRRRLREATFTRSEMKARTWSSIKEIDEYLKDLTTRNLKGRTT
jgi:hypothetical protein